MIDARAHVRLAVNGARWWLVVALQRRIDRFVAGWLAKNQGRN